MPNTLSHIILKLEVEPLGLIKTLEVFVAPNGRLRVTTDSDPAASSYSPDKPAGGPPVVRTVNLSLKVAEHANDASVVELKEVVALVQGVASVLQASRPEGKD
ncbi:hypothetical protein FA95DRAFT_1577928 [Auriscalpium vulgare]|uniref:Uncharacterized protein n=1 Tax=Auriscalpium vulgare TaxID=40419 RepID=A0ACB8R4G6_9AGAM|nr:hypothetical protein FA95DRAFT_1577928 [Auriscalpium vulgare]